jgi:hypothetical protein
LRGSIFLRPLPRGPRRKDRKLETHSITCIAWTFLLLYKDIQISPLSPTVMSKSSFHLLSSGFSTFGR